tara:strand:+ start:96 stop:344 length:249 start_codon:yes stop_codon:yes gene_type:complete
MDQTGFCDLGVALRRCLVKRLNSMQKIIDPDTSNDDILKSKPKYRLTIFFEKKFQEKMKKKACKKDFGCHVQLPFTGNTLHF